LTARTTTGTVARFYFPAPIFPQMFTITSLWIPFTITAAMGQVARNAMQRQLTGPLGTWGATNIRFLFGFPFAILFFIGVLMFTGDAVPWPTPAFWPWLLLGALCQIVATGLMLLAMNERSFGLYQDRGDPDRDLRFRLPRRPPDRFEGDCDRDRNRRRRHHGAAAGW
jgi:hypothetical protein